MTTAPSLLISRSVTGSMASTRACCACSKPRARHEIAWQACPAARIRRLCTSCMSNQDVLNEASPAVHYLDKEERCQSAHHGLQAGRSKVPGGSICGQASRPLPEHGLSHTGAEVSTVAPYRAKQAPDHSHAASKRVGCCAWEGVRATAATMRSSRPAAPARSA